MGLVSSVFCLVQTMQFDFEALFIKNTELGFVYNCCRNSICFLSFYGFHQCFVLFGLWQFDFEALFIKKFMTWLVVYNGCRDSRFVSGAVFRF